MSVKLPSTLPGKSAHLTMAPDHRIATLIIEQTPPLTAKESAVLVLLTPPEIPGEDFMDWNILLIKRPSYPGIHSAQISFPGGKCDKEDTDMVSTACREAYEELGIESKDIKIIGPLTQLYVPPSNFIIYPLLAVSRRKLSYTPDKREVSDFFHVPLKLLSPECIKRSRVQAPPDGWITAPSYVINGEVIWGATAMIIAELYQLTTDAAFIMSLMSAYSSSSNPDM